MDSRDISHVFLRARVAHLNENEVGILVDRVRRLSHHAEIVPGSDIGHIFGGPFVEHEVKEQLHALAAEMQRPRSPWRRSSHAFSLANFFAGHFA